MNASTDSIRRSIVINAPRSRVWQALSRAEEFGAWFGVSLAGQSFEAGRSVRGHITEPGYEHVVFEVVVERIEPERLLSWRWHPHAIEKDTDYSQEPTTLVVFELREVPGGTELTVTESGFDAIPASRRAQAFRGNGEGWDAQMHNIARHVAAA